MATLRTSQAIREVSQYLRDPERALSFEAYTYTMMFGHYERHSWRHWAISPSRDMLAIRLGWGPRDFIDNLRVAMLMEGVGIGPQRYCICFDDTSDDFPKVFRLLQLVLYALPQERMFIYPAGSILRGPFMHEPWLSRARVIQSRPSLTEEEYVASFVPSAMVSL